MLSFGFVFGVFGLLGGFKGQVRWPKLGSKPSFFVSFFLYSFFLFLFSVSLSPCFVFFFLLSFFPSLFLSFDGLVFCLFVVFFSFFVSFLAFHYFLCFLVVFLCCVLLCCLLGLVFLFVGTVLTQQKTRQTKKSRTTRNKNMLCYKSNIHIFKS